MHTYEWYCISSVSKFKTKSNYRPSCMSWFSGQKGKQTFYFFFKPKVATDILAKLRFLLNWKIQVKHTRLRSSLKTKLFYIHERNKTLKTINIKRDMNTKQHPSWKTKKKCRYEFVAFTWRSVLYETNLSSWQYVSISPLA